MKLIVLIIVILSVAIGCVNSQLPTDLFVNFLPNQVEETCKGETAVGVGYSFSINQCIVVEDHSYYFIVDALRAGWKIYNNTECRGKFDIGSYKNGSCVLANFAQSLPSQWATMYISESQISPAVTNNNTFIVSQYSDSACSDLQYYYYFVNGFEYSDSEYSYTFSCDDQSPIIDICTEGCTGNNCCTDKQYPTSCNSKTKTLFSCNTV